MTCIRDDSTECECDKCLEAEGEWWRLQEGSDPVEPEAAHSIGLALYNAARPRCEGHQIQSMTGSSTTPRYCDSCKVWYGTSEEHSASRLAVEERRR